MNYSVKIPQTIFLLLLCLPLLFACNEGVNQRLDGDEQAEMGDDNNNGGVEGGLDDGGETPIEVGGPPENEPRKIGSLSLFITDAAVDDAKAVIVQFSEVEIKPAEGPSQTFTFDVVKEIDLLAYQGMDATVLLEGIELPAGEYNWIRLGVIAERDVLDSRIILNDDSAHSLSIPGGGQTGLKINRNFTIAEGGSAAFTLDFDLRKSVLKPRGQNDYRLKPTLRITDNTEVGGISGTVTPELLMLEGCGQAAAVYVYEGADATVDDEGSANSPLSSALVNLAEDGTTYQYELGFLEAGDYTVALQCAADLDDPEVDDALVFSSSANVSVLAGELSVYNF